MPEAGGQQDAPPAWLHVEMRREERAAADQQRSPGDGDAGRDHDRDEAARLPFEQQQFDGQHDGGDGGAEDRGHAGGGTGDQQGFALGGAQMKELREQRADGAAGHDDRSFCAERATGADRDGGRERFQHRYFRRHTAAADQDRFDCLRNAVAADLFRTVACHEADDDAADDGSRDHPGRARATVPNDSGSTLILNNQTALVTSAIRLISTQADRAPPVPRPAPWPRAQERACPW